MLNDINHNFVESDLTPAPCGYPDCGYKVYKLLPIKYPGEVTIHLKITALSA
jgi:hypothetical protein